MAFTGLLYEMSRYLSDETTLVEFEGWIVSRLPYLYDSRSERKTQEIVDEIELNFAQLNESITTEEEFKETLVRIFKNVSYVKIVDYNRVMVPYNDVTVSFPPTKVGETLVTF